MNDLWLWRRLTSGERGDDAALIEALRELAAQPIRNRAAFLPALVPLAGSQHPDVRAAAIAGLAGCRGARGLAAIVAALDDPDPLVWRAACRALAVTGSSVPARLAHGLFHPRPEIRRQLLADGLPLAADGLGVYLRADPECAELARRCPWPKRSLALAVGLYEDGALEAAELCEQIAVQPPAELRDLASGRIGRSPAAVDAYLEHPVGPPPGADVLDAIARALSEHLDRGALAVLAGAVFGRGAPAELARRLAVSLIGLPEPPDEVIGLAVAAAPELCAIEAVITAERAAIAAAGLRRHRQRGRRLAGRRIRALLSSAAVGSGDRLDLDLAAAIAGLGAGRRLQTLAEAFGDSAIVAAIARSDRGWLGVCALPRESPPRWRRWLAAIADRQRHSELIALALSAWVVDRPRLSEAVRELDRPARASAMLALARLLDAGRIELSTDRLDDLAAEITGRLIPTAATELLIDLCELDTDAGREIAAALARELEPGPVARAAAALSQGALERFLESIDGLRRLPWNRELALARALADSRYSSVAAWARAVLDSVDSPAPPPAEMPPTSARSLSDAERQAIAAAAETDLEEALEPALTRPSIGLCEPLAGRDAPERPSVAAACALLASFDPAGEVAAQLDRYATTTSSFINQLDDAACRWLRRAELPPLADAALFRFERHAFVLADWVEAGGGLRPRLEWLAGLDGEVASMIGWRGIAAVAVLLRYRDRRRLEALVDPPLIGLLIEALGSRVGPFAARILVALYEPRLSPVPLAKVRDAIADRAADAGAATRSHLLRLMRLDGLPPPPETDAPVRARRDRLAAIAASGDLDELEQTCRLPARPLVEEAVLRLLVLGAAGEARLARLLGDLGSLPCPAPLIASVAMWTDDAALAEARKLCDSPSPEIRMRVALALCARGEAEMAAVAVAAARAPAGPGPSWFAAADWQTLAEHVETRALSLALIDSPHHRAYRRAFAHLADAEPAPEIRDALIRFLEAGSDRPIAMRRDVARRLLATWASPIGMPIILEEYTDPEDPGIDLAELPGSAGLAEFVESVVWMALIGGPRACAEARAIDAIRSGGLDDRADLWEALLEGSLGDATRQTAAQMLSGLSSRIGAAADSGRQRIAEIFAWGVKRGRELTGRLYRVHMTAAERALGHTQLDEDRIFVSALPLLHRERSGRDVVEGLILHELGHHVYHRGPGADAIWRQAAECGLFSLLNLIADEHLERNLRARDTRYGDRLKRLAAYAFQHASQEIGLYPLLWSLGAAAAPALIASPLQLAYEESSVRISRGAILAALEARGHPLARFARALRMGLGNRAGDPVVDAALSRFDRRFRKLDMEGLWQLTCEIAELFGGRVAIAEIFGGSEGITWSARDDEVFGADIDDDEVQKEVERILDPRRSRGPSRGKPDKLTINVNPDEAFDRITRVVRIPPAPERHRAVADEVKRHAARLRSHLTDLGLQYVQVGARVSGRHLDRPRIRALVTRRDPRILRARQLVSENDLFIGVAIDCSSSMQVGDNIGRARRFGVLVAEAVRGLGGVDARFFGFNDSVIYDAGDDARCAVSSLSAGGGNNDAAALAHLAEEARRSRRRARVLVMISDGLPTECSVAALRSLVTRLGRRQLLCAQVAVRPLEEVCFPDYVLLDSGDIEVAVARFGRMIADLARRALGMR